ncbi:MAG: hypothetical protein Q7S61_02595 [bacterium]|nr:hypothetical protein [bacterium]
MSIQVIVFLIVFVIIAVYGLWTIFTKKGRDFAINKFIGEIVHDYGIINEEDFYGGKQKIRLLRCNKNNESFYALETEFKAFGGIQFWYAKISDSSVDKLMTIFSNKE